MQRLEVSGAVRLIYRSLGVKVLKTKFHTYTKQHVRLQTVFYTCRQQTGILTRLHASTTE